MLTKWHEFKMWIFRRMIRRYLVHNEARDLFIEIEYIRQNVFYEDNVFDARAFYTENMLYAIEYVDWKKTRD